MSPEGGGLRSLSGLVQSMQVRRYWSCRGGQAYMDTAQCIVQAIAAQPAQEFLRACHTLSSAHLSGVTYMPQRNAKSIVFCYLLQYIYINPIEVPIVSSLVQSANRQYSMKASIEFSLYKHS